MLSGMAFCQMHLVSEVLMKQVAMNVILPDKGRGPFATFYLLHGMSDAILVPSCFAEAPEVRRLA